MRKLITLASILSLMATSTYAVAAGNLKNFKVSNGLNEKVIVQIFNKDTEPLGIEFKIDKGKDSTEDDVAALKENTEYIFKITDENYKDTCYPYPELRPHSNDKLYVSETPDQSYHCKYEGTTLAVSKK